jgi:hypothetical protein
MNDGLRQRLASEIGTMAVGFLERAVRLITPAVLGM